MIIFAASATTSGVYIPKLGIGLDQNIAMPDGSYVLKYFEVRFPFKLLAGNELYLDIYTNIFYTMDLSSHRKLIFFIKFSIRRVIFFMIIFLGK